MLQNRILFITLSNIGDAIMTTPVLQSLHAMYPAASVDIVADKRSSEIFLHCPYRGKIIHKHKHSFLRGLPALIFELRSDKYDLVVDIRTDFAAWLVRSAKRLSRHNRNPYGPHSVERHMGVIRSLHGNNPIPPCVVWTGDADRDFAALALKDYQGKKLLGIGPGANWPAKIWPYDHYLRLIESLQHEYAAVVLLGSEKDKIIAETLTDRTAVPCVNLCCKTTLLQAAAVLRRMSLFVGNDSGLGHLASAVNIPSITVFGPGDPERYRPWGQQARYVASSCADIKSVSVEQVLAQINFSAAARTLTRS